MVYLVRMKTKMEMTFLFFVAHAATSGEDSDLKCSLRTEAELGKDVILDCYCEPRCHVTHEDLKWKFKQNITVLAYRGTYDIGYQDAQFKGRAHVTSTEGLKYGNFPVTISTVKKSDEGIYTYQVGRKSCSVELRLKVKKRAEEDDKTLDRGTEEDKQSSGARNDNTTPTSGGRNIGPRIGNVAGVAVFAVGFVALLICRKRRTQRRRQPDERGPLQDVSLKIYRDEPSPNAGE